LFWAAERKRAHGALVLPTEAEAVLGPDPTSVLSAAIGAPNISLDQSYHYLPELLEILTEAIPSLFKSKQKWWEKKQLNYAYSREKLRAVSGMACRAAALSNRQRLALWKESEMP
jgi:hypothetical protein